MRTIILLTLLLLAIKSATVLASKPAPLEHINMDVVTACLLLEARGEGAEGMIAVMAVINNRAKGDPCMYEAVVLKRWQFSAFNSSYGDPEELARLLTRAKKFRDWELAQGLVALTVSDLIMDPTFGANHYHVASMSEYPYWSDSKKVTATIGNHIFYRL